ncbi:MAG: hypothetical protein PF450_16345 [Bacteroidales bacterium]|jgi:hypothetical protein|nr:hypothetical protein [Bacteroidales bacterium]
MRNILSGHSRNKGVTLITLIIAITIFAVFITVFSYVMIAKHGSEALYVQSTQAYAVAQAGIEYGIRFATDGYLDPTTYAYDDLTITEPLGSGSGSGSFTLGYTPANRGTLTSTGTVGNAERQIVLQQFRVLVAGQAITSP